MAIVALSFLLRKLVSDVVDWLDIKIEYMASIVGG